MDIVQFQPADNLSNTIINIAIIIIIIIIITSIKWSYELQLRYNGKG